MIYPSNRGLLNSIIDMTYDRLGYLSDFNLFKKKESVINDAVDVNANALTLFIHEFLNEDQIMLLNQM